MFNQLTRSNLLQLWFVAVAILIAAGIAFGPPLRLSTSVLVLVVYFGAPAILMMMWPSAPSPSVAEVLRSVD
jgi:hypothetical protein